MTEDQYRKLFRDLLIEARALGKVLRYRGLPKRVHFNRGRQVGICFSAHVDDEGWYLSNLWERIAAHRVQKIDRGRLNVVPRRGMEASAFQDLVSHWRQNRRGIRREIRI